MPSRTEERGRDETRGTRTLADVAGIRRTSLVCGRTGTFSLRLASGAPNPTLRCSPADDEGRRTTLMPVFRGGCRLGEVGDEDATTRRSRARGRRKRYLTRGSLEGGGAGERVVRVAGRAEARAVRVSDRPEKNAPGAVSFPSDEFRRLSEAQHIIALEVPAIRLDDRRALSPLSWRRRPYRARERRSSAPLTRVGRVVGAGCRLVRRRPARRRMMPGPPACGEDA